jgi:hypothetical protein
MHALSEMTEGGFTLVEYSHRPTKRTNRSQPRVYAEGAGRYAILFAYNEYFRRPTHVALRGSEFPSVSLEEEDKDITRLARTLFRLSYDDGYTFRQVVTPKPDMVFYQDSVAYLNALPILPEGYTWESIHDLKHNRNASPAAQVLADPSKWTCYTVPLSFQLFAAGRH